jgi:DNA polymerase-1
VLVTQSNFPRAMERLEHQPRLIHDTETTGLDRWHDDVIVSHIIATPRLGADVFYFPVRHERGENISPEQYDHLRARLSRDDTTYTGWNYKYDIEMGLMDGIPAPKHAEDVMLSAHLMNENEPNYKLKQYSTRYIDPDADRPERELIDTLKAKGFGGKANISKLDPVEALSYGSHDVVLTEMCRMMHNQPLRVWGLSDIWSEVNDYMLATVRMEQRGLKLDVAMTERLAEEATANTQAAYDKLAEIAGYPINPNSPPQMCAFTGLKSTRRELLEEIREGNPAIDAVIDYRAWDRANNTYYHRYLEHMDADGIVHPNLNLNGTVAGRPSASKPNMQAVPRYNKIYKIKDVFLARPGYLLVSADYSQAELRMGSWYARERRMIKLLNAGGDIHGAVSLQLRIAENFGIDEAEARDIAKRINFGVLYGIGAWKLAKNLRCSEADAKAFLDMYHGQYRNLRPFYRHMQFMGQYHGYIRMWTGRVRRYNTEGAQPHKALSNLVQGGVAEMMRHAILKLDQLVQEGYFHMVLQVHDQILFEVPIDTINECCIVIKEIMEDFPQFNECPPKVDISIGKRWGKMEKWSPENPYRPKIKRAA